jgi:hypothetical protein
VRIYVESSVKKNLTFLRSKISKKVKEQKDFSTLFFRKKRPQLFKSELALPPPPPTPPVSRGEAAVKSISMSEARKLSEGGGAVKGILYTLCIYSHVVDLPPPSSPPQTGRGGGGWGGAHSSV